MIAVETSWLVRLVAPLVWRSPRRIARKLESFAATEAGSALDMLKAAELCPDPRLRRLFFRHALDEARHAGLFRDQARAVAPSVRRAASEYDLVHATRQNLYERLGLLPFLAFVYVAERRGERQFRALAAHFRDDPALQALFQRIAKEERFHVAYARAQLRRLERNGRAREVRRALAAARLKRAWEAWRRAGRRLGDGVARVLLGLIYLVVLPLFVLFARRDPAHVGWQRPNRALDGRDHARRQF